MRWRPKEGREGSRKGGKEEGRREGKEQEETQFSLPTVREASTGQLLYVMTYLKLRQPCDMAIVGGAIPILQSRTLKLGGVK